MPGVGSLLIPLTSDHVYTCPSFTLHSTAGILMLVGSGLPCHPKVGVEAGCLTSQYSTWTIFLEKYCSNQHVQEESLASEKYPDIVYNSAIEKIHSNFEEGCTWTVIDKTTGMYSRYIDNLIVGKLPIKPGNSRHLICVGRDNSNNSTFCVIGHL